MAEIELHTTSILNGGSISVTVYEDAGGDGTGANTDPNGKQFDNSATTTLAGGTETHTLTGFAGGVGNDYWIEPDLSVPSITSTSPTLTSTAVDPEPGAAAVSEAPTLAASAAGSVAESVSSAPESGTLTADATPTLTTSPTTTEAAHLGITGTGTITEAAQTTAAPTLTSTASVALADTTGAASESGTLTASATASLIGSAGSVTESGTLTAGATAAVTESVTQPASGLTWETTSDWDAAQSETGIHHEQPVGTDWAPADTLEQGYSGSEWAATSIPTPVAHYPGHEDSGTTMTDVSGNANHGTYVGPTVNQTGILGHSAPSYDGIDDYAHSDAAIDANGTEYTGVAWYNYPGNGHDKWARIFGVHDSADPTLNSPGWWIDFNGDTDTIRHRHGTDNAVVNSTAALTGGVWYMLCARGNGSDGTLSIYDSTALVEQASGIGTRTAGLGYVVNMVGDARYAPGRLTHTLFWNTRLSDAQLDSLHAMATGTSSHISSVQVS